ncbi:MAG: HD domain-containing protein [Planctomycetota bacterium]|nr:HD domain-containing protein [Planctomycetota bacterium]
MAEHNYTDLARFRYRRRGRMIAALVALQVVVMVFGSLLSWYRLRSGVTETVTDAVIVENITDLERFERELSRVASAPIEYGSPTWRQVQTLVESFEDLSNGAFVWVLDEQGYVLAHPALLRNPDMRRFNYADRVIQELSAKGQQRPTSTSAHASSKLGEVGRDYVSIGRADFLGGPSWIATRFVPGLNVRVLVQQPEQSLAAGWAAFQSELALTIGLIATGVLIVTGLGSVWLVRRYDAVLSKVNRQLEAEVTARIQHTLDARHTLIFNLGKAIDARDADQGRHVERVARYSEILAQDLAPIAAGVDRAWIECLKVASSLHDLGKAAIPDSILLKRGPLSAEERRAMEHHALAGAEILFNVRRRLGDDALVNMAIQVVVQHHERYDGSGYPYGIAGEQISLAARIVALADAYDGMTTSRCYKDAITHDAARAVIAKLRGTQFDPQIVDAFERCHARFDEVRQALPQGGPAPAMSPQEVPASGEKVVRGPRLAQG